MKYNFSVLFLITTVVLLVAYIIYPMNSIVFLQGESMDPSIEGGCNIAELEEWDYESSLENKIVSYQSNSNLVESDIRNISYYVAHRVIYENENYSIDNDNYYISEEEYFVDNSTNDKEKQYSSQEYSDFKELEGEHVIVLKGDNNDYPDPEIINVENINGLISEDRYVNLNSANICTQN